MNPFAQLSQTLNRGLDRLRGPVVSPAAVQQTQTPPAAMATSNVKPSIIDEGDFLAGKWTSGEWSKLAYFTIPKGVVYMIRGGSPYRFFVKSLLEAAGANAAAANRVINVPGLVASTQGDPALPAVYHPDVAVWCKVGLIWSQVVINSVNFTTLDVNYAEPLNCTNVEVRFTGGTGEWRLRVARDLGLSDDSGAAVQNDSFSAAHTTDQNNIDTLPKFARDVQLTYGQTLVLEVNTTLKMDWNTRNGNVLQIRAMYQNIDILDARRLAQYGEIDARQGV
jgi:hypothetical protein